MAGVCALLAALAVAGMAQLTPTSITVSPTNPIISATQTQQFTALSGNTIELQGVIQVASGPGAIHTCALLANGTVECWGSNYSGELGNGTTRFSPTPVGVSGLSGQATAIAVSAYSTCALLSGGTVECWGGNYYGELGNSTNSGTVNANPLPFPVSGLSGTVTAIAAGDDHTCALLVNGTVECWGSDDYGQLGDNSNNNSTTPVGVSGLSGPATALAAGGSFTCALLSNGTVECWGHNDYGQLGNNSDTDSGVPVAVYNLSGATAIAAGEFHACALLSNGTVECWGFNYSGQLGNDSYNDSDVPVAVYNLSGATAIAAGESHACALLSNGTVECWGYNDDGQLGNSSNNDSDVPAAVSNLSGAAAVTAGWLYSCALLGNGTVECWGDNYEGELGNGGGGPTTTNAPGTPVSGNVLPGAGAKQISSGDFHTCVVISDGTVQCWGYNGSGELGNGTTNSTSTPTTVVGVGGAGVLSGVTAVAAGPGHTCALLANGTVVCWGDNSSGELGDGFTGVGNSSSTPVAVSNLTGVKAIAVGYEASCALLANGSVECWGYNVSGQLGNGNSNNSDVPVAGSEWSGLLPLKAIATGGYYTCGLTSGGVVYCLGYNAYGQLGDYSMSSSLMPEIVNLMGGGYQEGQGTSPITATSISVSSSTTCAVIADGSAQCWGYNDYGSLGDNIGYPGQVESDIPQIVYQLSGVTGISAGSYESSDHTCAALASGVVDCWGDNYSGQLGAPTTQLILGSYPVSFVPLAATGLNIAKVVSAAEKSTCALLADGTVDCWGTDYSGELGDGASIPGAPQANAPQPTLPLVASVSWTSGTTSVATIGAESGLATPAGPTGTSLITATYSAQTPLSNSTTLTVGVAPTITSASSTTFTYNAANTFTVTTTGFPAPALSESGTLPNGVMFVDNHDGTGTLSGTPSQTGTFPITFGASDSVSPDASQSFTLTVGTPPTITSASSTTFTVGVGGSFTVTTTGSPTPMTSESGALPSGLMFSDNGNGTGTLSGTPASGTGGVYNITFGASNNLSPNASQSFTLYVDQAPAITSPNSATFAAGTFGTFTVNTTGYPTPGISESGGLPNGVMFVDNHNGTGTLSGTPTSGGVFSISFTAANTVGSNAVQPFTLTVDEAPVFTSANSAVFTIGVAGSFTVTTAAYPTASITEAGHLPTGLTFLDNGNGTGTLSGTPTVFNGGDFAITFTAKNGIGSPVTQSFTIILQQAPAFTSATSATFAYGVSNSFTVSTVGFPAPSIAEAGGLPPGVTFVDNHNGTATLSGIPSTGGAFALVLTATNPVTTTTQNFTLNVSGLGVSPSTLSFGTLYLNGSSTLSVTVTNEGGSTVTITGDSITLGTANAATYKATSHCTSALKPGKSCTISVTFLANLEGTLTATLYIMDNGFGTPQQVNLTGNVIDPVAQFSPSKLSFGTVAVHTSATLPVQLTNSGQTPLDISGISIGGADAGDFSQTNNCPAILPAAMSCTISVTFDPTVKGARTGTLIITDNVAAGQSTVALSGTGH